MYRRSYFEAKFSDSRTGGGTARPLVHSDFASSQTGTLPIPAIHFQLFLHPIGALQPAGRTQRTVGHHLVERAPHRHHPDGAALPFSLETGRQHPHHRGCRTGSVLPYGSRQPHRVPGSMDLFQGIHLQYVSRVPNHGTAGNYKQISRLIFLFSILTLIAILKGLCQKFIGFDAVEYNAMMESGMYKTHLLPQITRYFSIFTDAGNYGSNMGFTCALFGIAGLFCKKSSLKVYYFSISALSLYSMFITGTRGAIVVPLGSLLLFALISKNIKLMSAAAVGGICIYVFFAFTYVGESNYMIRRMRTAFRPNKDASYLVRKQNQKKLAEYLRNKPFGEGLGLGGVEARRFGSRLTTTIPNDSTYVKIWTETGVVGILLYLLIYAGSLLWGCYCIMFKIRNDELRHLLTALACGIFGMMLSAYGNAFFTQFPTGIMMIMFLGILMNGKYIDERLTIEKQQALLTTTKKDSTL